MLTNELHICTLAVIRAGDHPRILSVSFALALFTMTGDRINSASVNNLFDGPCNSSATPDETQLPRERGFRRRLRWINAARVVIILFVSVILALPLVMFYLPQQGRSNEVSSTLFFLSVSKEQ